MRLEKISDNQIRCTLTSNDLIDRQMNISELAYGSEKARNLFKEMIQKASFELGFDAHDIPIMVEAIPLPSESVMLIITKVEDPDELDTRFAKFSSSNLEDTDVDEFDYEDNNITFERADEIIDAFQKLNNGELDLNNNNLCIVSDTDKDSDTVVVDNLNVIKIYRFKSLDGVSEAALALKDIYNGKNSLYKNPSDRRYYLVVNKTDHSPADFNKVCNIISEYGNKTKSSYATVAYYEEHFEKIIADKALQVLAKL